MTTDDSQRVSQEIPRHYCWMSDHDEARNMLQTSVGTLGRREVVATTHDRLGLTYS
jgi:hypothetical protein